MVMQGFMGAGATNAPQRKILGNGQMGAGAAKVNEVKTVKPPEEKTEEMKEEVKKEEMKPEVKTIEEPNSYEGMHHLTLRKIALAKGYTGEKFDKKTLIDFLNSTS